MKVDSNLLAISQSVYLKQNLKIRKNKAANSVSIVVSRLGYRFLTVAMPWIFDFKRKTRRVERITDVNGAAADTQKSFGFLVLCFI